ncbi:sushi, von Willebrand factor type A, EGF and pentraxin domain-containing protein 1-like isoform X2 [Macrobrachium rosenbergii]|uniref:sushi, von Willebrand factor type A, EGF and pentraxin domain-containing protein 1-like isoform X2 n=1 Tax=Macrobrachium rosenbergii TaxID=79674 RepID=UPI0034D4E91E
MKLAIFIFSSILTWVHFAHCQGLTDLLIREVRLVNANTLEDKCSEGSYCSDGFVRNGERCEDIDECAQGMAECSPHATCRNSIGSYRCSCNPPFEGDGRTCEFSCKSPAKVIEGLGCIKFEGRGTWQQVNATCQQAGWRLLQEFDVGLLQQADWAFPIQGQWIGVYEGKWQESGVPVEEELWVPGKQRDTSKPCSHIGWDSGSSSYKVSRYDCSYKGWGLCQAVF